MRTEEYISFLIEKSKGDKEKFRSATPIGRDLTDGVVFSQKMPRALAFKHTCVTGVGRTAFIKRLILALSFFYDKTEANFLVVSPHTEYGELIRLHGLDITVPFIREKADLQGVEQCVKELTELHARERGCPKLYLVLDGLEELDGCNKNGDLEEYRNIFDSIARQPNIEVITGADLIKTIFSGYPGAFVGIGNCLVTAQGNGKADYTFVNDDSSLSMPAPLHYPDTPSFIETVIWANAEQGKPQE